MTKPPPSWAALEAIHEHFRKQAFALVEDGQELQPMLFALELDAAGAVGRIWPAPEALMVRSFSSEAGKESFARMLHGLTEDPAIRAAFARASGFAPDVLVQVNEAWFVMRNMDADWDGRPASQQADRREAIFIALHMPGRTVMVKHEIVATPRRHAVRGAFPAENEADLAAARGRFAMQDRRGETLQ